MTGHDGYITRTVEIEAMDIPQMMKTPIDYYKYYVRESLLFQDHHGVVRAAQSEHPIAATREQIEALIEILKEWGENA